MEADFIFIRAALTGIYVTGRGSSLRYDICCLSCTNSGIMWCYPSVMFTPLKIQGSHDENKMTVKKVQINMQKLILTIEEAGQRRMERIKVDTYLSNFSFIGQADNYEKELPKALMYGLLWPPCNSWSLSEGIKSPKSLLNYLNVSPAVHARHLLKFNLLQKNMLLCTKFLEIRVIMINIVIKVSLYVIEISFTSMWMRNHIFSITPQIVKYTHTFLFTTIENIGIMGI